MSKSRIGPEAKIISLFAALPEDSKRIVLDVIKSQSATPRKVAAKKPATAATAPKELQPDKESLCGVCGNKRAFDDHQPDSKSYHEFDSGKPAASQIPQGLCAHKSESGATCLSPPGNAIHDPAAGYGGYHPFVKSVARAPRKSKQKTEVTSSTPSSETVSEGVTDAARAASGGD